MDEIYESKTLGEDVDFSVTSSLLTKVYSSLNCSICSYVMFAPFSVQCGHTFCYNCLLAWFQNTANCPVCRHPVEEPPVLNVALRDISTAYFETAKIINPAIEEELTKTRREATIEFTEDLRNKTLFKNILKSTALTIIDTSDGVPRCGNCHWEAHGSQCLQCGVRFRIPRGDDEDEDEYEYYESEDGDEIEDDEINVYVDGYGAGEGFDYDSDSSFIDNRPPGLQDIYEDSLPSDSDSDDPDVLPEVVAEEEWNGFNDDSDYMRDDELRAAVDEFRRLESGTPNDGDLQPTDQGWDYDEQEHSEGDTYEEEMAAEEDRAFEENRVSRNTYEEPSDDEYE